jgi:hypothetical protein
MYSPREPNGRPTLRMGRSFETAEMATPPTGEPHCADEVQQQRKPARRLTRNPLLAGIVNSAMRLWK